MGAQAKEVKIRLQSIKNTRKITKAMELVAAAKMRKSVEAALTTRNYHALTWGIVDRLINSQLWFDSISPTKRFFEPVAEKPQHTTIIVFTSNRGLCGAFNSNIIKAILPYLDKKRKENVSLITVGNKGAAALSSLGFDIAMAFKKDDSALDDGSVIALTDSVFDSFKNRKTDRVMVAYTDYQSAIVQHAVIRQLFPFKRPPEVGRGSDDTAHAEDKPIEAPKQLEYLYEPNKYDLLDFLIPRIAEAELYQALLESNASEHSARMVAMKSASDAAEEMVDDLLLVYNKARQAAITQEIAEISAGRAAVA